MPTGVEAISSNWAPASATSQALSRGRSVPATLLQIQKIVTRFIAHRDVAPMTLTRT